MDPVASSNSNPSPAMSWRGLLLAVLVVMLSADGVRCEGLMEGMPYRGTSRIRKAKNTYGSHYFLSFSAIPLKRRDGFYKNTLVSLNAVNYGITDHFQVGASMDLVSLIRSRSGGPIFSARMQVGGSLSEYGAHRAIRHLLQCARAGWCRGARGHRGQARLRCRVGHDHHR